MESHNILRIVQTADKTQDGHDEVFIIEDELLDTTEERLDKIVNWLSRLDIDNETPIYETIWHRLACPIPGVPSTPSALTHLIVLYLMLQQRIETNRPDKIVCGDIQPDYQAVVTDLAREHNIEIDEPRRVSPLRGYLTGLSGSLRRISDQLFSFLWRYTYDLSKTHPTVFIPNINRFDSMRTVIEEADLNQAVLIPRPTLSWLSIRSNNPDIDSFDPVPIDCFITLTAFLKELKLIFVTLPQELLFHRRREQRLVQQLDERFDIRMETTVSHALTVRYKKNMMALLYYILAEEVINKTKCEKIIFGSRGAIPSAMVHTAREREVATFHIPHTVTIGYETMLPETTYFATGDVAMQHFRESAQVDDLSRIIPAGRPYLQKLSKECNHHSADENIPCDGSIQITIATQPYNDNVREKFILGVLSAIERVNKEFEVVIKIHPNENPKFYESLLKHDANISVDVGDIRPHLLRSDLIVTINSNVGIESIVAGTPCVCVNLYSPLIRTRAYAKYSPVPVLSSEQDIFDWFTDLSDKRLQEMREAQVTYVNEHYQLDKDINKEILKQIQTV